MPSAAAFAWISDCVIPPAATAAPSVLTASPIQAAATSGSCDMKACAITGRTSTSMTAKITTSDDTSTGTCGRARIAPPVAIAAATPQIEIPEASGRRPFATEAEALTRDEVNDRPVDEVGLDDRRDPAQQEGRSEGELSGRGHGDEGAEDDDGDLDVELGADGAPEPFRERRKKVGDRKAGQERNDEAALAGELQRPRETKLGLLGRSDGGETRPSAEEPARIGDREDGGEGEGETPDVFAERQRPERQGEKQREVGEQERARPAKRRVGPRRRGERGAWIGPDGGRRDPAERVDAGIGQQRKREHAEPDQHREPILANPPGLGVFTRQNGFGHCSFPRSRLATCQDIMSTVLVNYSSGVSDMRYATVHR